MPTCVGFGTGRIGIVARSFSRNPESAASLLGLPFAPLRASALCRRDLPPRRLLRLDRNPLSGLACPYSSLLRSLCGYRNICLSSIGCAFRPRLRSRLTQGGRTFPWKPWAIGVQDSHLHFATHTGILSSVLSTAPYGTASPCTQRSPTTRTLVRIRSFGSMLSPGTFSAQSHSTSELLRTL